MVNQKKNSSTFDSDLMYGFGKEMEPGKDDLMFGYGDHLKHGDNDLTFIPFGYDEKNKKVRKKRGVN